MNCPVCTTSQLVMSERSGVEIDYCPKCRGVWLDRGELDKIVQKMMAEDGASSPPPPPVRGAAQPYQSPPPAQAFPPGYNPNHDSKYGYQHGQPRKKSMWKELFDF